MHQPVRLSRRRLIFNIADIYEGVMTNLVKLDYDECQYEFEEVTASIIELYLDSADRNLDWACVDFYTILTIFKTYIQSGFTVSETKLHVKLMVRYIMNEMDIMLERFEITRVKDYSLFGTKLEIVVT